MRKKQNRRRRKKTKEEEKRKKVEGEKRMRGGVLERELKGNEDKEEEREK